MRDGRLFIVPNETYPPFYCVKQHTMAQAELQEDLTMTQAQLQEHLHSLEERLLHPDRETDRNDLSSLLAPDFKEFCTSGRIFNLSQLQNALFTSSPRPATMSHFYVTPLGKGSALATYHITTATSTSHHSSIWVLRDNKWQMLFHQGTIAA